MVSIVKRALQVTFVLDFLLLLLVELIDAADLRLDLIFMLLDLGRGYLVEC